MNDNQQENKISSMLSIPTLDSLSENKSMPDFSTFTSPQSSPQRERFRGNQKKELRSIICNCVKAQQANRKTCLRARESFTNLNTIPQLSEQLFEAHYIKIRKIGEGGNSCVYACKKISDSRQHYAVKVTKSDEEEIIRSETDTSHRLLKLNHPNICRAYDFIIEKSVNTTYLIMELVGGKSLEQWIAQKVQFQENEIGLIMKGILEGIEYLHLNGFVHRDITPGNVIYEKSIKKIKIIDLSTCKDTKYQPHRKLLTLTGNDIYRAPEMFDRTYSQEVDVWSAGIILYILLFQNHPFFQEGDDMVQLIRKISSQEINWEELQMIHQERVSPSQIDLCAEMLHKRPEKRISASNALVHPFLSCGSLTGARGTPSSKKNPFSNTSLDEVAYSTKHF